MALVKTGGGVDVLSGKLGGNVFQRNGRVRAYVLPRDPRTAAQVTIRAAVDSLSWDWRNTMDAASRGAWEEFAASHLVPDRLGVMRNIGGKQWFIKVNVPRYQIGITTAGDPPYDGVFSEQEGGTDYTAVNTSGGTNAVTLTFPALGETECLAVSCGRLRSGASLVPSKQITLIGKIDGDTPSITTEDVSLPYNMIQGYKADLTIVRYTLASATTTRTFRVTVIGI